MQDVFGSVQVGVENHVAGFAPEHRALPLPLLDAAAYGASLGGIPCWNKLNSNSSLFPLVFEESLKLEKSPVGEEPVLLMPVPCGSDSLEVFQNQSSVQSCAVYQSSAYAMVDISHKTFLPATHLGKMPFGRTSAFGLQPCPEFNVSLFDGKNITAFIEPTIRGGNQIRYPSINADNLSTLVGFDGRLLNRNHQPELVVPAFHEVALFDLPIGESLEIQGDVELHLEPPSFCQETCSFLNEVYCAAARIIVDGSSRKLRSWSFSLDGSLHGRAGIFVGDNGKLGGETKAFPENRIVEMVHPEGVGFFMVVAGGNDKVLGISHKQKVFIKDSPLLWQFLNNSLYRFHHIPIGQEKAYKPIWAKDAYGKDDIIGEIQHQLSHRLVSKIQKGNLIRRPSRISQSGSAQHSEGERLGNLGVESHARPHPSFPFSTSKVCANRHHTTAKGKKLTRDVSAISTSENSSQERQAVVSKLLCGNRRTCFGRDDTEIHSRAGEGSQFLLWLKPEVSLRGAL